MSTLNWTSPVLGSDVRTNQAYLDRLQAFLDMQQPTNTVNENGGASNAKRKNPSTTSEIDTASSLKDRKHATSSSSQHSHIDQREESPPEQAGKKGRGSTSDKRKEQNRNAQRAFRERKEKVLKELEDKVDGLNKVNEQQNAENQNLRELVSRLQAENARLQQESSKSQSSVQAPQSAFTFEAPLSSSANAAASGTGFAMNGSQTSLSTNNGPASFSDEDILAFLNSAPPASNSPSDNNSSPFTLIQPSTVPSLGDDWAWNASAFGTEIPQSIAPGVTNIFDAYMNAASGNSPINLQNGSTTSAADASSRSASTTSANQREGSAASISSSAQQDQNQLYNNMFSRFSPTGSFSAGFNGAGNNVGSNNQNLQLQTGQNANARRSSSGASQSVNALNGTFAAKPNINNVNNLPFVDSPEATSSSNGSERSEVQPPTPSSFFGNSFTGNINNWFNTNESSSKPGTATQASPLGTGSFGQQSATAPTFDTMDYRDTMFGSTGGISPGYGLNKTQTLGSIDNLDFSDFLVQSPPAFSNTDQALQPNGANVGGMDSLCTASAPKASASSTGNSGRRAETASTSSVPGLSNSQSSSPSLACCSSASSPSNGIVIPDQISEMFPYDISYNHPLIRHVMPDLVKEPPEQSHLFAPKHNAVVDIDALCSEMRMKATCKEVARERIAAAIQDDEKTLELYQQYLRESRP